MASGFDDDVLALIARERQASLRHEADVFRALADGAPRPFGAGPLARARRATVQMVRRMLALQ